jgi:hypothetical protein
MPKRSITTRARRRPEDAPPAPAELYREPEHDIELLGEMLHDVETMEDLLRQLPFDREHYRANLRIVRGAAVRMGERCIRLLQEDDAEHFPPEAIVMAPATVAEEMDRQAAFDDNDQQIEAHKRALAGNPPAGNGRKRSSAVPVEGGIQPTIRALLQEAGTMSTTEIIDAMQAGSGASAQTIKDALAKMRVSGEVVTRHAGPRRMVNRLAS